MSISSPGFQALSSPPRIGPAFEQRDDGPSVGLGTSVDGKPLSVAMDRNEFPIAFPEDDCVLVNFGILSGREATQAELDRLALAFRRAGAGAEMTITAERRQDYGRGFEGVIHQVRVTLAGSPTEWVQAICRAWALSCAEDRSVEPLDLA